MGVGDDSSETDVGANRAVVGSLWAWVTVGRPSKWPLCELVGSSKECKFLFDSEPRFFSDGFLVAENFVSEVSEVGVGGNQLLAGTVFPHECVAHDEDVVTSTEGVREEGDRSHDNLRIFSRGLVTAGSVVIPFRKVFNLLNFLLKGAALATERDATSVDPDVFSDDLASDVIGEVELWVLIVKNAACTFHVS